MTPLHAHGPNAQALREKITPLVGKTIAITDHTACIDANIGYGRTGMHARIATAIVFLEPNPRSPIYGHPRALFELDYAGFEGHNTPLEDDGWCDDRGEGNFTCKSLGLYAERDLCEVSAQDPLAGFALLD